MIQEDLTDEEIEQAACTSYAYWAWTKLHPEIANEKSSAFRQSMALKEVRRHYIGEDKDYSSALEKLKACLAWRKSEQIDLFRVCFHMKQLRKLTESSTIVTVELTEEELNRCVSLEKLVENDLAVQPMAVRGLDKLGRAMIIKLSRTQPWQESDTPIDGYYLAHFYIAERAMAVSEFESRGEIEQVTLMADFSTYESGNSPPLRVVSGLVKNLQPVYPERLSKAFVLEAPLWMQTMITLLRPFLAAKTSRKFVATGSMSSFVASFTGSSGKNSKEDVMKSVVNPSQAMTFMMNDGHLKDPINTERQLEMVPFFEAYDSLKPGGNENDPTF